MVKRLFLILTLIVSASHLSAQSTNDFLVGAAMDFLKTDIDQVFEKVQLGIEGHYFVVRNFAVGAGGEFWTTNQQNSFMMGMRWYPSDNFFVRFRGLIGANEAALGGAWTKPLNKDLRLEVMGDYFFVSTEFALRAGVSLVLRKK